MALVALVAASSASATSLCTVALASPSSFRAKSSSEFNRAAVALAGCAAALTAWRLLPSRGAAPAVATARTAGGVVPGAGLLVAGHPGVASDTGALRSLCRVNGSVPGRLRPPFFCPDLCRYQAIHRVNALITKAVPVSDPCFVYGFILPGYDALEFAS